MDQTHIYFCLCGLATGIFIGIRMRSAGKSQMRMRAVVCNSYKSAESVSLSEDMMAPLVCGSDDVLVEVKAASLESMDIRITLGYGRVLRRQYHRYDNVRIVSLHYRSVARSVS